MAKRKGIATKSFCLEFVAEAAAAVPTEASKVAELKLAIAEKHMETNSLIKGANAKLHALGADPVHAGFGPFFWLEEVRAEV